jgi:hypothetical protein
MKHMTYIKAMFVLLSCNFWIFNSFAIDQEQPRRTFSKKVIKRSSELESKEEKKSKRKKVEENQDLEADASNKATFHTVTLIQGKGSKTTGGGPGGFFWWVYFKDKKAGKVYINKVNEAPIGEHASIQIFLNKSSQGKHIGRFAYQKACESSDYQDVYAHIAKKNIASERAASAAGFEVMNHLKTPQLLMHWSKKYSK